MYTVIIIKISNDNTNTLYLNEKAMYSLFNMTWKTHVLGPAMYIPIHEPE